MNWAGFVRAFEVVGSRSPFTRGRSRILVLVIAVLFLDFVRSTHLPRWGEKLTDTWSWSVVVFLCSLISTRTPLFFVFHTLSRDSSSA